MQGKRVIQSVRLLGSGAYLSDHKPDPISSLRIDDKREAIEVEQRIEGGIARPHIYSMLSVHHNYRKVTCCGEGQVERKPIGCHGSRRI